MSIASSNLSDQNTEPITQWQKVTASNLSKLKRLFTSLTPLDRNPDAAELIRRKKELAHAFHLRGLEKTSELWELEKKFERGEKHWENNIVALTKRPAEPWSTPINSAFPPPFSPLEYTIHSPQKSCCCAALAAAFAQPAGSVDHILTSPLLPPAQSTSPAREATQNSATASSSLDSTSSESVAPASAPTPAPVPASVNLQPF